MSMLKIFKDYIRGFDHETNPVMPPGYTITTLRTGPETNRDVSTMVCLLFFAIFWLGMENYMELIQDAIVLLRQRRTRADTTDHMNG